MSVHSFPYHQLAQELKRELALSNSKPGDAFQSARMVMEKYGVAYMTARRAIQELIDDGTLDREPGCKPRIARIPEITPETLLGRKDSFNIAVLAQCSVMEPTPRFDNYVYRALIEAIRRRGWNAMTSHVMRTPEIVSLVEKIVTSGSVDALIVSCLYHESIARLLEANGFPAVFIDFAPKTALADCVTVNNPAAAQIALRKLTDFGHRRIDFVGHLRRADEFDDDAQELRDAWAVFASLSAIPAGRISRPPPENRPRMTRSRRISWRTAILRRCSYPIPSSPVVSGPR